METQWPTTKHGAQDRGRVAAGQDYEVAQFAKKHGISTDEARELIEKHGNSRVLLEKAVKWLRT